MRYLIMLQRISRRFGEDISQDRYFIIILIKKIKNQKKKDISRNKSNNNSSSSRSRRGIIILKFNSNSSYKRVFLKVLTCLILRNLRMKIQQH